MVGPVMGSMIYSSLGYENTFFVFSGLLFVACVFVFFILPGRLNKLEESNADSEADEERNSVEAEKQVTFKMFLFNGRVMMATFSSMIAMVFMLFYNGILSVHLQKNMGVSEDNIGKFPSYLNSN